MAGPAKETVTPLALHVLRQESDAIARAADRLDLAAFDAAADLLLACAGKVVLLGTGKSGIAARKIASTLTSTGTAAIYLHPVDALHGDLGVVTSDDAALVVSNSGESAELLDVAGHLRARGVSVVAIVGRVDSSVARHADVVLDASVEGEADPLNLTPTTSTTVAMAIGDALAAALMSARGFSAEDFARNHPGGALGRRLTIRAGDLMHEGERNPVVREEATLMEMLEAITRGGLGAASVVDVGGALLGVVTDGDVRRTVQQRGFAGLEAVRAGDVMSRDPVVVTPATLAYDALRLMEDRPSQISVLPVVDGDARCVGLLRLHDVVQAGLR